MQFHFVNQAATQIARLPKKVFRKHFIEKNKMSTVSASLCVHSTRNISIRRNMISTKTQKMTKRGILNGTAASSGWQFGLKMKSKQQFIKSYSPQRAMIRAVCGEGENPQGYFKYCNKKVIYTI